MRIGNGDFVLARSDAIPERLDVVDLLSHWEIVEAGGRGRDGVGHAASVPCAAAVSWPAPADGQRVAGVPAERRTVAGQGSGHRGVEDTLHIGPAKDFHRHDARDDEVQQDHALTRSKQDVGVAVAVPTARPGPCKSERGCTDHGDSGR